VRHPLRNPGPARTAAVGASLAAATLVGLILTREDTTPAPQTPRGTVVYSSGKSTELEDLFVVALDDLRPRRLTKERGPQFDPTWSPDGVTIAYRDSRYGINENDEIWVATRRGTLARNITKHRANDWSPAWSPDGQAIAFASDRSGHLSLWTMAPDGSNLKHLTNMHAEYPSWSPKGEWIAYSNVEVADNGIWLIRPDGSGRHEIGRTFENDSFPAWSPDGRFIAFVRGYDGVRKIWIMRRDGTGSRQVTFGEHDDMLPAWSPDGHYLVFSRDRVLTIVRPDGSDLRSLGLHGTFASWKR
jgi:Tol biopolymer transport system component